METMMDPQEESNWYLHLVGLRNRDPEIGYLSGFRRLWRVRLVRVDRRLGLMCERRPFLQQRSVREAEEELLLERRARIERSSELVKGHLNDVVVDDVASL